MKKNLILYALSICLLLSLLLPGTVALAAEVEIGSSEQMETLLAEDAAELPKLAAPSNLKWGYTQEVYADDPDTLHTIEFPGSIMWEVHTPCQGNFRVNIFRQVGDQEEFFHWYTRTVYGVQDGDIQNMLGLVGTEYVSGTYRFNVVSLGDGINYQNSDFVWSEPYTYVEPDVRLGDCTNLVWNGLTPDFDYPENKDHVCGYQLWLYYSPTEGAALEKIPKVFYWQDILSRDYDYRVMISNSVFQEYGPGYYYFQVRTLSDNIEAASNGAWSELSEPFYLADTNVDLDTQIDSIIASNEFPENVRYYAQQLGTQELKEAMLADTATVEKLAELEKLVNGSAKINAEEAPGIDAKDVTIVGANLNTITSDAGAELVIGKPEKQNVVPELYDSTVALHFSMDLENVEDPENLKIPVSITLPVPANINPDFMVILHYHADGTVEAIKPAIIEKNGKTYASVVLSSFSDFVMTQTASAPKAPDRIYGDNRYKTGFAVADQLKKTLGVEKFDAIVVAYGSNFADALAGSYLAAQKNAPILLVNKNTISDVKDYVTKNLTSGGTVYLLGGTAAVPAEMETALAGLNVKRLAGANRYATNLLILDEAGTSGQEILICTGKGFADSLSASAVNKPILLVNKKLDESQKEFLKKSSGKFIIIGGESAVSAELEAELKTYGSVERIGGANRYETSVAVAKRFFTAPKSAVLAYAKNFPDGLCGGPLAYAMKAPLILTATKVEAAASGYAKANGIKSGIVLGGEGLISNDAVNQIFG